VAIIGVLLSFFVLLLSFIANVRESSWQLGVLRAIGLTERSVLLIYIYEALCVVLACTFLGLLLGSFTAITLTLQSNLFTEMPFVFTFPGSLIAIVVILCLLSAIIGSVHPVKEFNKRPIAITLRG
jgi:ABC-type antimicrobial peptide transport system permease subunit